MNSPENQLHSARCIRVVLERFPGIRRVSLRFLERNDQFMELCAARAECVQAVARLSLSEPEGSLRKEYVLLLSRIDEQLMNYFQDRDRRDA